MGAGVGVFDFGDEDCGVGVDGGEVGDEWDGIFDVYVDWFYVLCVGECGLCGVVCWIFDVCFERLVCFVYFDVDLYVLWCVLV